MKEKYFDLYDLIEQNEEAGLFFADLPDYIQEMIDDRADKIRSVDELVNYADNLLSGDH